ncbi:MAG: tetratricopeptide repeat protein, partial [Saprospiraceae bacterium]|nr:tetratricopeptide repeat protein [Saprospiraceae bacterium]
MIGFTTQPTHSQSDSTAAGKAYLEIGLNYLNNQDLDSARIYFEKALPIARQQADTELLGDLCIRLGQVYRRRGDPMKANNLITEAIAQYENKFGSSHTKIAAGYNDLSIVQNSLGDIEASGKSLIKALSIREKLLGRRSIEYGMVLNNLALHYLEMDQLDQAIKAAKETVQIFARAEYPDQRFHVSSYNTLAKALDRAGKLREAEENYLKAIELHEKYFPGNSRIRFYLLDLGRNAMAQGEYQEAVVHFHHAMSATIAYIDPDSINQNPLSDDPSNYLSLRSLCLLKGSALHKLYSQSRDTTDLLKAIALYNLADLFATKNRVEVQYQRSREAFSRQNLSLYEGAILAHIDMWEETGREEFLEKSFLLNEKSKSLTLLQNLLDANALRTSGIPPLILQQEERLQDSLALLRNALQAEKDPANIESLKTEIRRLDLRYEEFKKSLEKNYVQYYQSKYNFKFKTLKEIQRQLQSDQSIMEFFVGDDYLFVYTINSESFRCHKAVKSDSLTLFISGLIESLRRFDPSLPLGSEETQEALDIYTDLASKLYQLIWMPFAEDLKKEVM